MSPNETMPPIKQASTAVKPIIRLPVICAELQALQRRRVQVLKTRMMIDNRLRSMVAVSQGYKHDMPDAERKKSFDAADKFVKQVLSGEVQSPLRALLVNTHLASQGFDGEVSALEKEMVTLAKSLPVSTWVFSPAQRGFGLQSLAIIVGESGDLSNYPNPAKLWRRMGCAPFQSGDKTLMGATWKSGLDGKLSAKDWEQFGYSPRRRSVMYLIGENMVRNNQDGPYRKRYDETKAAAAQKHPDWPKLRCHRHAMLLASKRLLLDLWVVWTRGESNCDTEKCFAASSGEKQ